MLLNLAVVVVIVVGNIPTFPREALLRWSAPSLQRTRDLMDNMDTKSTCVLFISQNKLLLLLLRHCLY